MLSGDNRSLVIPADADTATPAQQIKAEGDTIADRLCAIRQTLPEHVQLVCVSKYKSRQQIMEAYQAGERLFAESRVQELVDKAATLPDDIQWHFIGHLQTNKVRQVLPVVSLIQSVDSEHLLQKISDEAVRLGKQVDVLLELHVAQEQTKTGFSLDEARELLSTVKVYNSTGFLTAFPSVRLRGLMCMASNTDDMEQVAAEFARVSDLAHEVFDDPILSMGMSEDYLVAIKQGSNMVRIGSAIFGER